MQNTWEASLMVHWVKTLPAMQKLQEALGLIPGSGRSPGGGNGNLCHYSFFFFLLELKDTLFIYLFLFVVNFVIH